MIPFGPARYARRTLAMLAFLCLTGCAPSGPRSSHFQSRAYPLTGPEPPLGGPAGTEKHLLVGDHPSELVWLTGVRASLSDAEGQALSNEMLSALNVDLANRQRHCELLGVSSVPNGRLFSLSGGSPELRLPPGFGIPLLSSEPLNVTTVLMNLDPYRPEGKVTFQADFSYTYQSGLDKPMVALWEASAYGLVSLDRRATYYGLNQPVPLQHGHGCSQLPPATGQVFHDPLGQSFAADWLVPPGGSTTRTLVTRLLNLPYDTTLHYANAQLLPHARSVELVDLTDQRTILHLQVEEKRQDGSLARVSTFSSLPGVPMPAGHEYEMVAVYDNPGRIRLQAKASLHLYLRDQELSLARITRD